MQGTNDPKDKKVLNDESLVGTADTNLNLINEHIDTRNSNIKPVLTHIKQNMPISLKNLIKKEII